MKALTPALRAPITDLASGKRWIEALHAEGLAFHFDDDPTDCLEGVVSEADARVIGRQRDALYALQWGPRPGLGAWYCPIGYLMRVEALAGELPSDNEPLTHGALTVYDRDRAADYDYGAPGRFEVRRDGVSVGRFDCYADMAAAVPELLASEHFRLCVKLEDPSRLVHPSL